jgi:hypothetical protein
MKNGRYRAQKNFRGPDELSITYGYFEAVEAEDAGTKPSTH